MIPTRKFTAKFFALLLAIGSTGAFAESSKTPPNTRKLPGKQSTKSTNSAVKVNSSDSEDGYVAASSTQIDFSETSIDGKMKAPEGFLLQGRQGSSLSQMVKLRSNFRNELNNSKSATKALVK